jgi:hydrogenase maturation protein HypF
VGVIFDGTGYGDDGTLWGGELLVGDLRGFERVGHLWPVRMPGGEAAIRAPWRMACGWLHAIAPGDTPARPAALADVVDEQAWRATAELVRSGLASPWTTSVGRLFDALAALCGVCARVSYEGQAAIEFEAVADCGELDCYPVTLGARAPGDGRLVLDARPLVAAVAGEVRRGVPIPRIAARAHNGLANAAAAACRAIARGRELETVVLSGGVFQNALLLERTTSAIERAGLRVLLPERVPPNDGGIAYGQLAIAATRAADRAPTPHVTH